MRINECSCGCGGSSDKCADSGSEANYMFFGNLETMKRMIDELVQMDRIQVDEILKGGHEWAVDHIASSADDIQEVYNFLKNSVAIPADRDPFAEDMFVKTFESYISEVSHGKWREVETDLRGRGLDKFADRVASHNREHGTGRASQISFVGLPEKGYYRDMVELTLIDFNLTQKSGQNDLVRTFKIVGKDASFTDWGTVVIYGTVTNQGSLQMFESERVPLLMTDRKSAMGLINFLVAEKVVEAGELDWRKFTDGYVSFDEVYNQKSPFR